MKCLLYVERQRSQASWRHFVYAKVRVGKYIFQVHPCHHSMSTPLCLMFEQPAEYLVLITCLHAHAFSILSVQARTMYYTWYATSLNVSLMQRLLMPYIHLWAYVFRGFPVLKINRYQIILLGLDMWCFRVVYIMMLIMMGLWSDIKLLPDVFTRKIPDMDYHGTKWIV